MAMQHVAIYTKDLLRLTAFYCRYFGGEVLRASENPRHQMVFIGFGSGCQLELMSVPGMTGRPLPPGGEALGITHLAFDAPSTAYVRQVTEELEKAGYTILVRPRWYGRDYYESCFLDPDGNRVELSVPLEALRAEQAADRSGKDGGGAEA